MKFKQQAYELYALPYKPLWRRLLRRGLIFFFLTLRFFRCDRIFSKDPHILSVYGQAKFTRKKLCIFASYSALPEIPDYIHFALDRIAQEGFDIVFVYTGSILTDLDIQKLLNKVKRVVWRKNVGYDFASWKAGLLTLGDSWKSNDQILFMNDSSYFPLYKKNFLRNFPSYGVCGITDSLEPRSHLMSYFLLFHADVIQSPAFLQFWQSVHMLPRSLKLFLVVCYELGLSDYFRRHGFALHALFPIETLAKELALPTHIVKRINPLHDLWHYLIAKGCPVIKVDLFRRFFIPRRDNSWRQVIAQTDYDIQLILDHQRGI